MRLLLLFRFCFNFRFRFFRRNLDPILATETRRHQYADIIIFANSLDQEDFVVDVFQVNDVSAETSSDLVGAIAVFSIIGVPFLAKRMAYLAPVNVLEIISQQTIDIIDQGLLEKSKLSSPKKAEIKKSSRRYPKIQTTSFS